MASIAPLQTITSTARNSANGATRKNPSLPRLSASRSSPVLGSKVMSCKMSERKSRRNRPLTVAAAVGDVSSEGTTYLIAGAIAVALVGTAFPILFSRKDTCPECDGAGFVRQAGGTLRANAARKDQTQIVCARCNGLGKINQIDK